MEKRLLAVSSHKENKSKEHSNGPILEIKGTEIVKALFPNFILTVKSPDNVCCLRDGSIILISNFIKNENEELLVGQKFLKLTDLYEKPSNSSMLGIFKAYSVSNCLPYPLKAVTKKYVCFRAHDCYILFPLLHSDLQQII